LVDGLGNWGLYQFIRLVVDGFGLGWDFLERNRKMYVFVKIFKSLHILCVCYAAASGSLIVLKLLNPAI